MKAISTLDEQDALIRPYSPITSAAMTVGEFSAGRSPSSPVRPDDEEG